MTEVSFQLAGGVGSARCRRMSARRDAALRVSLQDVPSAGAKGGRRAGTPQTELDPTVTSVQHSRRSLWRNSLFPGVYEAGCSIPHGSTNLCKSLQRL